ncbi:hypothetical protein BVRB_5g111620 [Beta vulgaris subsp. vulgaris]|nr:hypothetical protein BVRB_5g111620 [Beta vulgaris subsp. vulgaris]
MLPGYYIRYLTLGNIICCRRKLRRKRLLVDIAILGKRSRLVKGTTLQE